MTQSRALVAWGPANPGWWGDAWHKFWCSYNAGVMI
jgi:hypothetical protein